MDVALKQKMEEVIQPFVQELSLELVELDIKRRHKTIVVDVIADRPQGGITMDQCASLNKLIATRVEMDNLIADDYVIEVASPGLDRPLKGPKDFSRVIGRNVRFHLSQPLGDKIEYAGIIKSVEAEHVSIQTKQGDLLIPFSIIHKALQVIV